MTRTRLPFATSFMASGWLAALLASLAVTCPAVSRAADDPRVIADIMAKLHVEEDAAPAKRCCRSWI